MKVLLRFTALIFTVALLGASSAQVSVPNTPAGRVFAAWLKAFDSGDRATYRKFLQTSRPEALKRLPGWMDFRQTTGGFDLKKIETSTPTKIAGVLEDRLNEQFARFSFVVLAPHHATLVDLTVISRPAQFALQPFTQDQLVTSLRSKLQRDAAADRFAGAVLLAKDGQPVFEQAYGLSDRAHNAPNTLQTRFRLGSMNKMFTAVAILQLAQAGKISLDAPLGTYLTDYPNKDVYKVTIHQLLTHTGGTGDIFGPRFHAHRLQLRTLADYQKLYGTRGLLFKPGSRWDYSNYGFILLGLVIEKISGQSYYDYVRDHIYAPTGMTSTASEPEDQAVPNRSIGYMTGPKGQLQPNTDTLPYRGMSAGGGYSTVGDLLKFANALLQHKLLNGQYTDLLTTGKVAVSGGLDNDKYAYGFEDRKINGVRCFGHNGGAPGMNGQLDICPGPSYVVAVLSNLDPPTAGRISDFITNRLPKH